MSRGLKIFLYILGSIFALFYVCFLFVLPNVIDLNQYKEDIQKIVKEQTNLNLNFENPKIITTPLFGAGIKADNISVRLPDNSELISADSLKTRIALPSLALLTVKVSCFEAENPFDTTSPIHITAITSGAAKAIILVFINCFEPSSTIESI